MKIAYVYDAIHPYIKGGAEKRIYELSKRLSRKGHEVHWFGVKWWDGEDVIKQDDIYLHGVCKVKGLYTKEGKRSINEALYFGYRVFGPLLKDDFDIIDAGEFPYFPCFSSKLVSAIKRTPFIITWHEVWGNYWYDYLGYPGIFGKFVERLMTKLPHKHIAVSKKTKKDLASIGVDEGSITVIPNGIDFNKIQQVRPSKEEVDVLYVGRLIKDKNVDMLIKAVASLKEEFPDVKCKIIGEGPEKENLIRLSKSLGLEKNTKFLEFMTEYDDVIAHMKSSKVFVLPSTREGFGIVLIETMACGTPVIGIKAEGSGVLDVIDGKNGILCELNDLTENMMRVLKDKKLRKNLTNEGYNYSKKMDWETVTEEVLGVYERVRTQRPSQL